MTSNLRTHWRAVLSWIVGAAWFTLVFRVLHLTAGWGGLTLGVLLALGVTWAMVWRGDPGRRRQLWIAAWTLTVVTFVWDGFTFTRYVLKDNGDTATQRMTTWGRDHGLGRAIDWMETVVYNDPPSKKPADELTLAVTTLAPDDTDTTDATTGSDAVTSTTIYTPPAPDPLPTSFVPALPGEGQWLAVGRANGLDAMWATSLRPLADTGGIVATVVVIDQTYLRVGMFNGRETPGGSWVRDDHVPPELWPALVGAMNGGFRLEHSYGGYMAEGRVVQKLIPGRATLAITREGKLVIGELGRDIIDDGSWQSLRQNLVLMVDGGQSGIDNGKRQHVYWGAHSSGEIFVNRSAVCELKDGRIGYVMAGKLNAPQLAQILINVGCMKAVQLDINGSWPNFALFGHNPDGSLSAVTVDHRMSSDPMRYVKASSREFFAFFDASLVPAQSVLDT